MVAWPCGTRGGAALGAIGELRRFVALAATGEPEFVVLGVGIDDATDETVADDILAREVREVDVRDLLEDAGHQTEPRRALRKVDLGDVAGDDHAGAESETRSA